MENDRLLYIHRVAKLLDCSRPMVYKLIHDGKIRAVRIGKRGIRISESSLQKFLKENTIDPDSFNCGSEEKVYYAGDVIRVKKNSKKLNELAGQKMVIVRIVGAGVFAKDVGHKGTGVFVPFSEIE